MGPLDMLYGWQALLCAIACYGLTALVKAIVDVVHDVRAEQLPATERQKIRSSYPPPGPYRTNANPPSLGTIKRKQNLILTRIVLPAIPIVTGAIYANLVPFVPDQLISWFAEHEVAGWQNVVGLAVWGASCGVFSTFLYDRVKKLVTDARNRAAVA